MNRILACLIGVSVAALPAVAEARGNGSGGGGHCATGSRGNSSSSHNSSHHSKGSGTYHVVPYFSTFWLFGYSSYYRAGYVQPDGTYVEPSREEAPPAEPQQEFRNECPPDMECSPSSAPSPG